MDEIINMMLLIKKAGGRGESIDPIIQKLVHQSQLSKQEIHDIFNALPS